MSDRPVPVSRSRSQRRRAAGWWLAAVVGCSAALGAGAVHAEAGPVELEFWRSAQAVGTVAAYQSYLDAYPTGTFAALARAAMQKSPTQPPSSVGPSSLKPFVEAPSYSSAVPFSLGDRFSGPGVLYVGWAGAKKQVLLPPGEWIALSAVDHRSEQSPFYATTSLPVRASMTSVVFGRFEGTRTVGLFRAVVSSQRLQVSQWSDVAGCQPESALVRQEQTRVQTRQGETCWSVRAIDDPASVLGPSTDETRQSLARLGATPIAAPMLAATASIGEARGGYLGLTRLDAVADPAARPQQAQRLAGWLDRYRAVALRGLDRSIDAQDLAQDEARRSTQVDRDIDDDPRPPKP